MASWQALEPIVLTVQGSNPAPRLDGIGDDVELRRVEDVDVALELLANEGLAGVVLVDGAKRDSGDVERLARLEGDFGTRALSIIAYGVATGSPEALNVLRAGADDCLDPDASPEETCARLRVHIERSMMRHRAKYLEWHEGWLSSIIQASPVGMLVARSDGTLLQASEQLEKMFGYERGELEGQPVEILVPREERSRHEVHRKAYLDAPTTRQMGAGRKLNGVSKNGALVPVEIGLSPVFTPGETIVIGSIINITERVRQESERQELLSQLREAVEVRDNFLAVASHELKTPVSTLLLELESVRRRASAGGAAPAVAQTIERAIGSTHRLARLVENLLDVSRIAAQRFELHRENIDFRDVVRDVVARFEQDAARRSVRIVVEASAAEGVWDRLRLEQVVTNLLSNALKFGGRKPIRVRLECTDETVSLHVEDQGVGVAQEQRDKVFERFESGGDANYGGLGLGLYVTREIVVAHGGEICVESAPNAGSTFSVHLPRTPPSVYTKEPHMEHSPL